MAPAVCTSPGKSAQGCSEKASAVFFHSTLRCGLSATGRLAPWFTLVKASGEFNRAFITVGYLQNKTTQFTEVAVFLWLELETESACT